MQEQIIRFLSTTAARFAALSVAAAGETNAPMQFVQTKVVDGLYIGVTDEFGHTNAPPTNHLCFCIWTTNAFWTNDITMVAFPVDPEYACDVQLFGPNGAEVPRSENGGSVGRHFQDFDPASGYVYGTGWPPQHGVRMQRTAAMYKTPPYELLVILRPSDIFDIKTPGRYVLRIHFQIVASLPTGPGRSPRQETLVRFPPVDFPVVKAASGP